MDERMAALEKRIEEVVSQIQVEQNTAKLTDLVKDLMGLLDERQTARYQLRDGDGDGEQAVGKSA